MRLRTARFGYISALVLALAGCGSRTDPGRGTKVLEAQIEVSGREDSTSIELALQARGNPVLGANVVFTDVDSGEQYTAEMQSAGNYRSTIMGYPLALRVRIVSADDFLEAQLESPAPHSITQPPNDSIVRGVDGAGQPFEFLVVRWSGESAQKATVHPEGSMELPQETDIGAAEIPLANLSNGDQRVGVTRQTSVNLAGGAPGSQMRTRYRVDNRFTLER